MRKTDSLSRLLIRTKPKRKNVSSKFLESSGEAVLKKCPISNASRSLNMIKFSSSMMLFQSVNN